VPMKCVTCGKENDSSAKFCGICGTELNSSPEINYELHEYQANDQGMVGFGEAIKLGFVNYFKFSGRATRAEFWWWILFGMIVSWIPLVNILSIFLIIPNLSITSRRLHDIDKTGWWQLWVFLLFVGLFILFFASIAMAVMATLSLGLLIMGLCIILWILMIVIWIRWLARQGESGTNRYGSDPRTTLR